MMNYKISVVVPVYKVEAYLDECITSLIRQTYRNLEIILIDDGSPDKCPLICDAWAERDSRIKVIHKKNEGQSKARNVGLEMATGDFVGFVDSDDWIAPEMYERLINGFSAESVGITSCNVLSVKDGITMPWVSKWMVDSERIISCNDYARKLLTMEVNFSMWSKLYRRKLFEKIRFRDGRLNEDSLLVFDLSKIMEEQQLQMQEIPYAGYFYRQRDDSSTNDFHAPLEIEVLHNYEEMSKLASAYDAKLSKSLIRYRNYRLYQFLFKLLTYKNYSLFDKYYKEFCSISAIDIITANNLHGRSLLQYFLLRYYPQYYIRKI